MAFPQHTRFLVLHCIYPNCSIQNNFLSSRKTKIRNIYKLDCIYKRVYNCICSFYRKVCPQHFRRWVGKMPTQEKKTFVKFQYFFIDFVILSLQDEDCIWWWKDHTNIVKYSIEKCKTHTFYKMKFSIKDPNPQFLTYRR